MRYGYYFSQILCQLIYSVVFHGRSRHPERVPQSGGVLLVCNHQSFFDPVLAGVALERECDFMARDTLFKNDRFRRLIEWLNAFPVKRGTADVGAIKETLRRLKAGRLIVVFPEATRTHDGEIAPMQSGPVLIARKAGVPIVPVLILGAFEAWPRDRKFPRPHPILVSYGHPISPDELARGDVDDWAVEIRARIIEMQRFYQRDAEQA